MVQVIWSYAGLVSFEMCGNKSSADDSIMFIPATAQMTFKHYQPKTKEMSWKSVSVGGFKPNGRGCKSDQFVCLHLLQKLTFHSIYTSYPSSIYSLADIM